MAKTIIIKHKHLHDFRKREVKILLPLLVASIIQALH